MLDVYGFSPNLFGENLKILQHFLSPISLYCLAKFGWLTFSGHSERRSAKKQNATFMEEGKYEGRYILAVCGPKTMKFLEGVVDS